MKAVTIQIPDMQSAHCQMRVTNAIKTVEGATINNIEPGMAAVSLENDELQTEVVNAIEKAGYKVAQVDAPVDAEDAGETFYFKTNIKCSGCVAEVEPFLNAAEGICHWDVDTNSVDKVLSVHSEGITKQEVIDTVKRAGYNIESLV